MKVTKLRESFTTGTVGYFMVAIVVFVLKMCTEDINNAFIYLEFMIGCYLLMFFVALLVYTIMDFKDE